MSTISVIARSVAADIERFGHFQYGKGKSHRSLNGKDNPYGLCCIIANPTAKRFDYSERRPFEQALEAKINEGAHTRDWQDFVTWSDTTPTPEVVATLRSL